MSPQHNQSPRRRLPREERTRQLLEVAWQLIGNEGTDALTLGRLAEAAGVTKPVVYDHFGTRNGLLAALYQDYDERQTQLFDAAIEAAAANLQDKSRVIAASYVNCVLTQGREISDVVAALNGSPELAAVKKQYQHAFIEKCATILAPFCTPSGISAASLWAMLGAADSLSDAAVAGDISEAQARDELQAIILGMVERSQ
ncbi:TetR/AcrR family transcriptional regulator [Phytopseudomonas punonensis]|uniref:Transcriptional regulator, TetR family n=1 Tax=Phytopseudomonas punonensis TaxID=1220495 RepID=A0A1M7FNU8_9GAMM|nr:TetR/AcrR family transcriptional regulator [Pseudomonas punonensis]SHM05379.1 transcriptional regulator, TetR family [Pseudomonas punonensis]